MKAKKFDDRFTYSEIKNGLSAIPLSSVINAPISASAYYFTKRNNPTELESLLKFLPDNYVADRKEDIESIDLVCSGSATSPFLITISVGRNDRYQGKECFDVDVFNIAPNDDSTDSYFLNQWHHYKNKEGKRATIEISPFTINNEQLRKDITYNVFLTGSNSFYSIEKYEEEKSMFYDIHNKSFLDLSRILKKGNDSS